VIAALRELGAGTRPRKSWRVSSPTASSSAHVISNGSIAATVPAFEHALEELDRRERRRGLGPEHAGDERRGVLALGMLEIVEQLFEEALPLGRRSIA
jgi:hypothetical protein